MTKHVFIIRIWNESYDSGPDQAVLRGFVQHVPSQKKHFLTDLNTLIEYISPFLADVKFDTGFRLPIVQESDPPPVDLE